MRSGAVNLRAVLAELGLQGITPTKIMDEVRRIGRWAEAERQQAAYERAAHLLRCPDHPDHPAFKEAPDWCKHDACTCHRIWARWRPVDFDGTDPYRVAYQRLLDQEIAAEKALAERAPESVYRRFKLHGGHFAERAGRVVLLPLGKGGRDVLALRRAARKLVASGAVS